MKEYRFTFSFHPDKGRVERIAWKSDGTDMYDAHNLGTAAALKDYPKAHGFLTTTPDYP